VRGKTFKLGPDGRRVNAFLGIPYARAGTNLNRFKVFINHFIFVAKNKG
jgi:hypothetical protein